MTTMTEIDNAKRHGQHYTPTALADFLARRAFAAATPLLGAASLTIVDPACGDGELLLAAARAARDAGYDGELRLTGYEIDTDAIDAASERLSEHGVTATIIEGDFLVAQRSMPAGSIDIIITNPPYVRTQHLGQAAAQLLANEFGLTGRVDLTHPFVTVAGRLLRENAVLALLCSNRFLSTLAGENVRRALMAGTLSVGELYDLGDTKLFKAAVLPAVIIASKASALETPPRYASAYEIPTGEPTAPNLFAALEGAKSSIVSHGAKPFEVKVGTLAMPDDTKTPWRLSDPDADAWLSGIDERAWKRFGDVAKIRVGIKTTADKVFLSDDWSTRAPDVENELLLPLLDQRDITPWRTAQNPQLRVLYPYDLSSEKRIALDVDDYPGTKAYLLQHEEQLRGRTYVIEGGRHWYEIWVPQRPALWADPKIVFPDISESPRFALDTTGAVVNGNCYWISLRDIADDDLAHIMLAVANSSLGLRYYDEVCGNRLYSGKRRWITQYVKRLPLPDPSTPESRRLIDTARSLVGAGEDDAGLLDRIDREVEAAFAVSGKQARAATDTLF